MSNVGEVILCVHVIVYVVNYNKNNFKILVYLLELARGGAAVGKVGTNYFQ